MKKIALTLFLVVFLVVLYGEKRSFYCIDENKCITVWKTFNNTCYVIPGKYYGLVKPVDNYILTTNTSSLDVIWEAPKSIIVNISAPSRIINPSNKVIQLTDYRQKTKVNDSLFTYFDGRYRRYKRDVNYLTINIKENYAVNNKGEKL